MPAAETSTAQSDLDLLLHAARAAGELALTFSGPTARTWDKPGQGPVTEADFAVNDLLHDILRNARPDYGWLSEETPDTPDRLGREAVFIVDPIDGTRSFIEGSGTWAHSLAIAVNGAVTAAVVHLPARQRTFSAALGNGAFLNGVPISTGDRVELVGSSLMATRPTMQPRHWVRGIPDVVRAHRPSLAYRMSLISQGRFDAMLTLRPAWHWDIAAGSLIAEEAGAKVTTPAGENISYNTESAKALGVLTANPTLHALIRAELA